MAQQNTVPFAPGVTPEQSALPEAAPEAEAATPATPATTGGLDVASLLSSVPTRHAEQAAAADQYVQAVIGNNNQLAAQARNAADIVRQGTETKQDSYQGLVTLTKDAAVLAKETAVDGAERVAFKEDLLNGWMPEYNKKLVDTNRAIFSERDDLTTLREDVFAIRNGDFDIMDSLKGMVGLPTKEEEAVRLYNQAAMRYDSLVETRNTLFQAHEEASLAATRMLDTNSDFANAEAERLSDLTDIKQKQSVFTYINEAVTDQITSAINLQKLSSTELLAQRNSVDTAYNTRQNLETKQFNSLVATAQTQQKGDELSANREQMQYIRAVNAATNSAELQRVGAERIKATLQRSALVVEDLGAYTPEAVSKDTMGFKPAAAKLAQAKEALHTAKLAAAAKGSPEEILTSLKQSSTLEDAHIEATIQFNEAQSKWQNEVLAARRKQALASIEKQQEQVSHVNRFLARMGSPVIGTYEELEQLKATNPSKYTFLRNVESKVAAGVPAQQALLASNPMDFVKNAATAESIFGKTPTVTILGEEYTKLVKILGRDFAETSATYKLAARSAAAREGKQGAVAITNAANAQLKALTAEGSGKEYDELFRFRARDFMAMENNHVAQSLGTVLKSKDSHLTLDILKEFTSAFITSEIEANPNLDRNAITAKAITEVAALFGAVHKTKPDLHSLSLSYRDAPVISIGAVANGVTSDKDLIDLSNPAQLFKVIYRFKKTFHTFLPRVYGVSLGDQVDKLSPLVEDKSYAQ